MEPGSPREGCGSQSRIDGLELRAGVDVFRVTNVWGYVTPKIERERWGN